VDRSSPEDRLLTEVTSAAVVFAAMLVATIAGQLAGIAIDAALGTRAFWVPVACSVGLEGVAGARVAASRLGRPLTPGESGRATVAYSLVLLAISIPLAVWIRASSVASGVAGSSAGGAGLPWTPRRLLLGGVALAAATVVRWAVLVACAPRAP
jgi:hypothetical protein